MKRQFQDTGVRKYFGDDFINMQTELLTAIEGIVKPYGNCILSGCEVTNNGDGSFTIGAGIAFLLDSNGLNGKICRVYENTVDVGDFPLYIYQASRDKAEIPAYGRPYKDGNTKNIIVEYYGYIYTIEPAHANYVRVETTGALVKFRDALQNSAYRFVTDAQKTLWNGKLNASEVNATPTANKVPILDAGAKLPIAAVPNLPASQITSGTFGLARLDSSVTANLLRKTFTIGNWNMVGTLSKSFSHGLDLGTNLVKLKSFNVIIFNDDYSSAINMFHDGQFSLASINATIITLTRVGDGSRFNSTEYNSATTNRGHFIIEYEA